MAASRDQGFFGTLVRRAARALGAASAFMGVWASHAAAAPPSEDFRRGAEFAALIDSEPEALRRLSETADRIRMVLAAERAAFATLAVDRAFAITGSPPEMPDTIPAHRASLAAGGPDLGALGAEDALAAEIARGGSDGMLEDLLLGDAAGTLDLALVERIGEKDGDAEWRCLAEAIYFEARGEPLAGQVAVGEVVLNRVDDPRYPDTICDVTHQGADTGVCQFSYECDGKPETVVEFDAFETAGKLAHLLLSGRPRVMTGAATHFHTTAIRPSWSRRLVRIREIGDHIFYRYPTRVSSN